MVTKGFASCNTLISDWPKYSLTPLHCMVHQHCQGNVFHVPLSVIISKIDSVIDYSIIYSKIEFANDSKIDFANDFAIDFANDFLIGMRYFGNRNEAIFNRNERF